MPEIHKTNKSQIIHRIIFDQIVSDLKRLINLRVKNWLVESTFEVSLEQWWILLVQKMPGH